MMESDDDIFDHIKSVLRNHEEPYEVGAWERFQAAQAPVPAKKASIPLWKWAVAAAAIVTGVFFAPRIFNSTNSTDKPLSGIENLAQKDSSFQITETKPQLDGQKPLTGNNEIKIATHNYDNSSAGGSGQIAAAPYRPGMQSAILGPQSTVPRPSPLVAEPPASLVVTPPIVVLQGTKPPSTAPTVDFWKNKIVEAPSNNKTPVYQEPQRQLAVTQPAPTEKPRKEKNGKWEPSLYVSPLLGDLGIDMGYGIAVGYAISDKIRISSGLAYNKLSASRNYGAGPVGEMIANAPVHNNIGGKGPTGATGAAGADGAASSLDSKGLITSSYNVVAGQPTNSLVQVDGSLSGIDIPVEINYSISKKLYASAGISGLVVINDNKKYTYVDNRNVKISVETNRGNLKEDRSVLFSEQNTTNQPLQAPKENTPFLGFYNLSLGYRQKLSGKTGVALEPFIKVPMRNVTQENLKYIGTGIRLKFDL